KTSECREQVGVGEGGAVLALEGDRGADALGGRLGITTGRSREQIGVARGSRVGQAAVPHGVGREDRGETASHARPHHALVPAKTLRRASALAYSRSAARSARRARKARVFAAVVLTRAARAQAA